MNGWEFLSKLENQKFKNELTIYMISSSIDPTEIKKSKEFKTVKRFISKPVSASNFLKKLKN